MKDFVSIENKDTHAFGFWMCFKEEKFGFLVKKGYIVSFVELTEFWIRFRRIVCSLMRF